MIGGGFLKIQPNELKMPFELKRQSTCSMQVTNMTDHHVAFKVKTTSPKKYSVRPNVGVINPRSSTGITVTMQAPKESPADLQCKDKFLIQSVVVDDGITVSDINSGTFNKVPGKVVEEFKLRVIYVTASPPSPVPEEEEETSSRSSTTENEDQTLPLLDFVSGSSAQASVIGSPDASTVIWKLNEEKNYAIEENRELQQQMELLRKQRRGGFSTVFLVLVTLLGMAVGYLIKST